MPDPKPAWRTELSKREFRRQALSLADWATRIREIEDFPNKAPRELTIICGTALECIAEAIADAPPDEIAHVTTPLNILADLLRYAETSKIAHTPWSMIECVEDYLRPAVSDRAHLLICPQWIYNYSAFTGDIVQRLRKAVCSLPWFSADLWDRRLGSHRNSEIFYVSFPRAERMNALLHALLGHEFGHILACRKVDTFVANLMADEESNLRDLFKRHFNNEIAPHLPALWTELQLNVFVSRGLSTCRSLVSKALHELAADSLAMHLFGPSAFAALLEFAALRELDDVPSHERGEAAMYPPWRYRIRLCVDDALADVRGAISNAPSDRVKQRMEAFSQWVERGSELAHDQRDIASLQQHPVTRAAYDLIKRHLPLLRSEIVQGLPEPIRQCYRMSEHASEIGALIERIEVGAPPNESGAWPNTEPASLPSILNAGWAMKCFTLATPHVADADARIDLLNSITLKGVEAAYVQSSYKKAIAETAP